MIIDKKKFGSYTVEVSDVDKVLFPEDDFTKGDLIDYYNRISDVLLPHLKDRPITMQRFPDGINEEGFYQKEVPDYFPDWIERIKVEKKEGGSQNQVICNNKATLVYLADKACITPHIWLSRKDQLHHPDKIVFDLDPPDDDFEPVRSAASSLKKILDHLDLTSFVMTTGSRGLHVAVALDRSEDFDAVRDFAQRVAEYLASKHPDIFTTEERKKKRRGRLFLDILRNAYGQTSVAPYAVRAKTGAPIATPIDWKELKDKNLNSQSYTIDNIFQRLGQKDDPWKDIYQQTHTLDKPKNRLQSLPSNKKS
ncbi:MAG: non-homologous end-joining DNA ligase [Thermoproteota archaeon]